MNFLLSLILLIPFIMLNADEEKRFHSTYQDTHLTNYIGPSNFKEKGATTLAATCTIDKPGTYVLTTNIYSDITSSSTSLITITSNNVQLDLSGHTLLQNNNNGTIAGITIQNNLKNITIKNGFLCDTTNYAIIIGSNCSSINITDLFINGTKKGGISIGSNTAQITIEKCAITDCSSNTSEIIGIYGNSINDLVVRDCSCSQLVTTATYDSYGIKIESCANCTFFQVACNKNSGKKVAGISCKDSSSLQFMQCSVNENKSLTTEAYGIEWNNVKTSLIENCQTNGMTALINAFGISLTNGSNCNFIFDTTTSCQESRTTGNATGIELKQGNNNSINHCKSFGNNGGSSIDSLAIGIKIDNESYSSITNCFCNYNDGKKGKGYGLLLTSADYCVIKDNKTYYNKGEKGSWGIFEVQDSSSFFAQNESFANATNYKVTMKGKKDLPYKEIPINKVDELPDSNEKDNISITNDNG